MIEIIVLAFVFVIALVINKGVSGIKSKEVRAVYLIFVGFLIQLLIFNEKFSNSPFSSATPIFYVISLFILLAFLLLNLHYRGILISMVGFSLNLLVILANKGFMPQDLSKLELVGAHTKIVLLQQYGTFYNAMIMSEKTHLNFLGDNITAQLLNPFVGVYSIGDIIILLGLCVFIFEFLKKPASFKLS
ncbi:MAG: DUF5317 domain-containing protein [Caldisericaceae bacterium]|nr:DUF5317 domain-containing protein [Caldisericaceae bacterium]